MLLFQLDPPELAALILTLVVGLTVHEYCHARVAFALGDLTAYLQGRLTLNPMKHIDPLGAIMMLMVGFGWARPVPVDPYRLGRDGMLKVALAGPASNVALAALAALPIRLGLLDAGSSAVALLGGFLVYFAAFNILLAVFNMLPIPPLDGWKVLMGVVPPGMAARMAQYEAYGFMALFGLLLLGSVLRFPVLSVVMGPFIALLGGLILGPACPPYVCGY
jgi:Zn-dependent protease